MNENELLERLSALRADQAPERELWPAIATRIAAEPRGGAATGTRSMSARRWVPLALAASLVAAVGLGLVVEQRQQARDGMARAEAARVQAERWTSAQVRSLDGTYEGAVDELRAHPAAAGARVSPGLYTAAAQLEVAEAELKASLAAEPRAIYLIEMLGRTQAKRLELEKLIRTT